MKFIPHDYQAYAIDFIREHPVSALFLDMGLGKTVSTLTAIQRLYDEMEITKVLVVAPLRVARNTWPDEVEKWDHLKDMVVSVVCGTEKERIEALSRRADIYTINRENVPWLVTTYGKMWDFDMVVIDELSSFKSHNSQRTAALLRVRPKIRRMVGLTGTPASNGLMDLFAEFKVLDGGKRLEFYIGKFRGKYFVPDKTNGHIVYSYRLRPGAEERIYDAISDITISMKAVDHLDMPKLVDTDVVVKMDFKERSKYKALKDNMVLDIDKNEITAVTAASLSGKLTQMANGAVYNDDGEYVEIHSRKLDALEDIIEQAYGEPVLVAYWYKHDLERIKKRLDKLKVTYDTIDTDASIRAWNSRELTVGLIHPAGAGHGLNLQRGGHHLVWFGLTWSLELYQQTNARLYRQGQESGAVTIQHIVASGTVDEQIRKALKEKDVTQDKVMRAVRAELGVDDEDL